MPRRADFVTRMVGVKEVGMKHSTDRVDHKHLLK